VHLVDLDVDRKIILKYILEKHVRVFTGLNCLMMETSGGLL